MSRRYAPEPERRGGTPHVHRPPRVELGLYAMSNVPVRLCVGVYPTVPQSTYASVRGAGVSLLYVFGCHGPEVEVSCHSEEQEARV